MKIKIFIILLFLPLFIIGQSIDPPNVVAPIYKPLVSYTKFGNILLQSPNTFEKGAILSLRSNDISIDSLSYNSSADLVTWSNVDTVVLDGSGDVVIDNYVRFGSPTSANYRVIDTLESSDSIIVYPTFAGSVTDEYYWGGISKWYDSSSRENNAIQTTAIYQPKLLYGNSLLLDGADDYLYVPDNNSLSFGNGSSDGRFSLSAWINIYNYGTKGGNIIGKFSETTADKEYRIYYLQTGELFFLLYDESNSSYIGKRSYFLPTKQWVNVTGTYDGSGSVNGIKVYVDGVLQAMNSISSGTYVAMENLNVDLYIGGKSLGLYHQGELDDVYIQNRIFLPKEIEILYKNSIHYTP